MVEGEERREKSFQSIMAEREGMDAHRLAQEGRAHSVHTRQPPLQHQPLVAECWSLDI